eukprot:CAMPEP_0204335964 /NCGR_PEP_ID=MMETSP0469-20131031/19202_1 /ASSEMBLY_ACC=CAM_ASM_000384 /TAXON_ID=2969 /ORGANISM="Oxyrrhis marina" /LENGTH=96 /DNA_ID=CAMNT_0051319763 /DNA_START=108 /DNA_END=398 /DNA_ORIENTATION=-
MGCGWPPLLCISQLGSPGLGCQANVVRGGLWRGGSPTGQLDLGLTRHGCNMGPGTLCMDDEWSRPARLGTMECVAAASLWALLGGLCGGRLSAAKM